MKSPFRKLYDFASKHGLKDKISSDPEEDIHQNVAKRMQDVEDMRAQYEGLLTNGQTISGAAYDFSRSLQDMASYMMETFGEIIDQEIGNVFSMLAKVQFEMSKLLDLFAAHVSQTIIIPTEMMMTEIQQVEVIREQYDEKLQLYNRLQLEKQKGKLKKVKGNHSYQQSVLAKEYMKEQVDVLNFHMEALMQGQSQSLITQAAKYHSAQMHLFSKGLASINAVEPLIMQLAQERNIDRTVSEEELPNNGIWKSMESDGEGEAPKNDGETDGMASSPRHILEPPLYSSESSGELKFVPKRPEGNSKSAPISPSMYFKKEGPVSLESEHERVFMYALPSPSAGAMGTILSQTHTNHGSSHPQPVKGYYSGNVLEAYKSNHNTKASYDINRPLFFEEHGSTHQYTHITDQFVPLQQHANHQKKASTNGKLTTFTELTKNGDLNSLPAEKGRRYSHSGPFTADNPLANSSRHAPASNASSMAVHEDHISRLYKSGPVSRSPMPSYMTRTSHSVSPPPSSPPQISELHKLPLPPLGSMTPPKSPSPTANSAPLARKVQEVPPRSGPASPLPPPPPPCDFVTRSLSIPSSANHIHEWQQEWTSNGAQITQLRFPSPPLEHMILPVSTGVMY